MACVLAWCNLHSWQGSKCQEWVNLYISNYSHYRHVLVGSVHSDFFLSFFFLFLLSLFFSEYWLWCRRTCSGTYRFSSPWQRDLHLKYGLSIVLQHRKHSTQTAVQWWWQSHWPKLWRWWCCSLLILFLFLFPAAWRDVGFFLGGLGESFPACVVFRPRGSGGGGGGKVVVMTQVKVILRYNDIAYV